jgi:hypothetical protein
MIVWGIGAQVYLNGNINTNVYPRGDMGVNKIRSIFVSNIKGTVWDVEEPSIINHGQYIYTVKILENLYAIEIHGNKLSPYPINTSADTIGFTPVNKLTELYIDPTNPLNQYNPLNPLSNLDEYSKLNYVNQIIQTQNQLQYSNYSSNKNHKTIIKYYYNKLVDEWIYRKLFPLVAFVDIVNSKPQLIKSMDAYNMEKLKTESDRDIEKRVEYLEKYIFTKKIVKQILKKIVKKFGYNWEEMDLHEERIIKIFYEYFKELLETSIR